jgi:hypothetical protein
MENINDIIAFIYTVHCVKFTFYWPTNAPYSEVLVTRILTTFKILIFNVVIEKTNLVIFCMVHWSFNKK